MGQLVGLVLAGGAGRRMGAPKGALDLEGKPLARRAAETLWPVCGTVLISVAPGAANPAPAFDAIEDAPPAGRGPLAGLAAGFAHSGDADLLVLACDYPRVTTDLLRTVLRHRDRDHDLVMPTDRAGRDHPLVALWRRTCQAAVGRALGDGMLKVAALLAEVRVRRLDARFFAEAETRGALLNVNTPVDLGGLGRGLT